MPVVSQTAPVAAPEPHKLNPAGRGRWWLGIAAVVAVTGIAFTATHRTDSSKTATSDSIRMAKVTAGPITQVLRISGATAARNFAQITAPMMRGPDAGRSLVLMDLVKSGSMVKKGDFVAQIDAQAVKDHVDDIKSQIDQADADVKKRKAEQAIEMETLRQSLRVAQANLEKAKLDAGAAEIRTDIDREILRLAVEEADATHKELQTDLVTTQQKHASEIKILEYTKDLHARHRARHLHDLEKFTIIAPIGGLVVMQSIWRGGDMAQIQQGDQINPGQPFLKIVDPSSMQLEAAINQSESEGIRIGQPAEVHFDAFPDLRLTGKVSSIGAMGVGGWRENYYIRNIPVRVAITQQDPRVIPDLSANADVTLRSQANAILVPLAAVHQENGKNVVFVKNTDVFQERQVELGMRNNTQAAVVAGLRDGEDVALDRPTAAK